MDVKWLGKQSDYRAVYNQMKELLVQRINNEIEDTLLLVEHDPVYTVGRARNAMSNLLNPNDVPVEQIERGGDVTFHGTGQLTGYPIVKLPVLDIHAYLRFLEEFWITELDRYNIVATRDDRNTGVWVNGKKVGRHWGSNAPSSLLAWVCLQSDHGLGLFSSDQSLRHVFRPRHAMARPCSCTQHDRLRRRNEWSL